VRGQGAYAGDGAEPAHRRIGLGRRHDLAFQRIDCGFEGLDLVEKGAQCAKEDIRQTGAFAKNLRLQFGEPVPALGGGDAELRELTAHAVQKLRVLLDQKLP